MNQYGSREDEVLTHQTHLDAFLQYVALNRTEETARLYRAKLRVLIRAWDQRPVEQWTTQAFETFVATGKAGKHQGQLRKWSTRSVQMYLGAAKLFGEYLQSNDVPCPSFWTSIKKPRDHIKEARFFTMEQAECLLEASYDSNLYPCIALGLGAAMRRAEMLRARWEDLDWEAGTIVVHRAKVGMSHRIPITPFLRAALTPIRKESGPIVEGRLSNASRDMKVICQNAKVPYASLHALRHGFASEMLARGVPVNVVAKFGGWRNLKTLGRYAHVLDGAMAEAAKLLG